MSAQDLVIQCLVRESSSDSFEVLTERKIRYEQAELVELEFQGRNGELWTNDEADTYHLAELDWDIAIITSDHDVELDLWPEDNKTPSTAGARLFLRGGCFYVIQRELWVTTLKTRPPFGAGAADTIQHIEVTENKGNKATVRGRFYKQATS